MFDRSSDQELFAETTRKFLETECPSSKLRELSRTDEGFERDIWRRGAELGWTSLVVPEEAGGGSVSEDPILDLVLLAYEFGAHAAPGPLQPTNLVAAALGHRGSDAQKAGPLAEILSGEAIATWALFEPAPADGLGRVELRAEEQGGDVVLTGTKFPVESAAQAEHFLVTARRDGGVAHFLVPAGTPGITVTPLEGVDLTRRFASVRFDGVRVPADAALGSKEEGEADLQRLVDLALVMQLGEMVGAMQWGFDTTLEWAFNRYSFGRPLASYQEIKHRFADMKMWLEASYAITDTAARAYGSGAENASQLLSAGKCYVGGHGGELLQDCVQLHGGIGVTFDHDIHLYLRRVTTNIALFGSPTEHAIRITEMLEAKEGNR